MEEMMALPISLVVETLYEKLRKQTWQSAGEFNVKIERTGDEMARVFGQNFNCPHSA